MEILTLNNGLESTKHIMAMASIGLVSNYSKLDPKYMDDVFL